jgi:hypothetical protein
MTGVTNQSPSLNIINLISNKKINEKKKLKKLFLKNKSSQPVEKRLKTNIVSNFIKYKKHGFFIKKNAYKIIIFFNLIKKIYKLKSDA